MYYLSSAVLACFLCFWTCFVVCACGHSEIVNIDIITTTLIIDYLVYLGLRVSVISYSYLQRMS